MRTIIKKTITAILSLAGMALSAPVCLHAQEQTIYRRGSTTVENTLPPSPEAASAVKYVDVPFSHSQGLAQYEVPVYTLRGRELTIPVSLSYATGGIRMDEVAGVAGLGWTLNAGGVITRTVVDMPDEFSSDVISHQMPSSSLLSRLDSRTEDLESMAYLRDIVWHRRDASADRYSYSVCGLSGSFIFDGDGDVVQLSGDGVDISCTLGQDGSRTFTIKGPDGTVYSFAAAETGIHDGSREQPVTPTSGEPDRWAAETAWHLTSMTSRSGLETATFSYMDGGTWDQSTSSRRQMLTRERDVWNEYVHEEWTYRYRTYETRVLSSITLSGTTVSFSYARDTGSSNHAVTPGNSRQNYPSRLTGVSVSTPGSPDLLSMAVGTQRSQTDGRIVLSSLRIFMGNYLHDRYDFTYKDSQYIPSRFSQDWFGYYNGEDDAARSRRGTSPYTLSGSYHDLTLTSGVPDASKASHMCLLKADHDGASTEFSYEGAFSGTSYQGSQISVGVRVRRITIRDGEGRAVRVRRFSYSNPAPTGPVFPLAGMYMTTSAAMAESGGPIETGAFIWNVAVHDTPVGAGPSIMDTRVLYGTVTEDVSGSTGLVPVPAARTVRHFACSYSRPAETYTISRFPDRWEDAYSSDSAPSSVDVWDGVRNGFADAGPTSPALLTGIEEYSSADGLSFTLLSTTEYTYQTGGRTDVLTDYVATQVMQRLEYGNLQYSDIYHYPVYATTCPGSHPVSERRTEYHAGGGSSVYTLSTNYALRSGLDRPVRPSSMSMTEGGITREVSWTYADTWTGSTPSWVSSLRNSHCLSEPLVTEYRTWQGLNRPSTATTAVSVEYASFTIGGRSVYMPKWTREHSSGTLSWSEEVKERDALGNPAAVKSTGKPETVILWSWNGLHPAAVVENATLTQVRNVLGGQGFIDGMTTAQSLSSARANTIASMRNNASTRQSHVTTYIWSPGVGVTAVTDPAGVRTSYEYDSSGRLSFVKDKDGRNVTGYTYNLLNDGGSGRLSMRTRRYRNTSGSSHSEDVEWFNTLGMRLQDIAVAGAGDGRDLVTAYEGDFMLHDDVRTWLPYAASTSSGSFQTGAASASATVNGSLGYYGKGYEASGRDRLLSSSLPGQSGSNVTTYATARTSGIPRYRWVNGISQSGTWAASELTDETVTDPDGRTSHTLKDHAGRTIATWTGADEKTYYVYDLKDRLRAVKGGGIAVSDTLNMWRYSYDSRGRISSKGVPGSTRESYTYDSEDRVVYRYRGSGAQAERTGYTYDSFGRVTSVSLKVGTAAEQTLETHSHDSYPSAATAIISATVGSWSGPSKDLRTYSSLAVTDGSGALAGHVETVWLYDGLERPSHILSRYPDGSIMDESLSYTFSGEVASDTFSHTHGGSTETISTTSAYDIRGRLTSQTSVLTRGGTTASSVSSQYSYDDHGRPSGRSSSVPGGVTLSSTDSYTVQQWTASHSVSIDGDVVYSETLGYDGTPAYSDTPVQRSGLVSRRTDSLTISSNQMVSRTVGYAYDGSGRLAREHTPSANVSYSYDPRGNVTRVDRASSGGTSSDVYSYTGDRLSSVSRTGQGTASFTHDSYGRMTFDGLEGVSVQYNHMDLPKKVLSGGATSVEYSYLSDGTRTAALDSDGEGLVYRGPFTYRRSASGALTLEAAACPEGLLTDGEVLLHVTDHLGSTMAVMRGSDGALYEASEYDAYGKRSSLTVSGAAALPDGVTLRSGFTGKEDQAPDFGIGYTDFGARLYSPASRRWMVPDPLSEKYYGFSPYAYCAGNPVNFVDSDGRKIIISGSEDYVKRVKDAEGILQSHDISVFQSLRDSRQVYTIRDAHDNNNMNAFDGETRTIYWNPKESAYDSNKKVLRSPLVRLVHELGHASQFEEDYVKFILLATTDSPHYSNQAEKIIIQGLEQIAARAFGEIRDDQVTRSGHYGRVGPDLGSLSVINQSSYCAWMNNPLPEVHESPELFDIAKLMK